MLEVLAVASTVVFILASAGVGGRLVLLARRTRRLPELSLGLGLLIIVAVAYPLLLGGRLVVDDSPALARWLIAASAVPMGIGRAAVWIFTLNVFRPQSAAARLAVAAALFATAMVMVGWVHHCLAIPDPADIHFGDPFFAASSWMAIGSYVWAGAESFRYWSLMKRRVALGLADPVVTNRFFLFGCVMVASTVATGIPATASLNGIDLVQSPLVLATAALAGLGAGATLWLAFLPPQSYLGRLRATA